MLKLEDSSSCESLGPGFISKINNIDMGGAGGEQSSFPEKSRFSEQNSQDILSGVVGLGSSLRPSLALNIKAVHYSML